MNASKSTLLITNATLWAGSNATPTKGWLLLEQGHIKSYADDTTAPPKADTVIDMQGHHILPSFVDCHTHLSTSAWIPLAADASQWQSKEDALRGVEQAASSSPEGSWLLFMNLDYTRWPGRRYPSGEELEDASGGRPTLLVDISLHRALASESTLKRCNFSSKTKDPHGDLSKGKRGALTGELWESKFSHALTVALAELAAEMGPDGLSALLQREAERHLSLGITDAHDPCIPISIRPFMEKLNLNSDLRVSWSMVSDQGFLNSISEQDVYTEGYGSGPATAKVFLDGAHRCAMCMNGSELLEAARTSFSQAFKQRSFDPLRDLFSMKSAYQDGHFHTHYLRYDQTALDNLLGSLSDQGLRLKIHAIGNLAAQQAIESINKLSSNDNVTLEHLTLLSNDELEQLSKTNSVASIQPGFTRHYGPSMLDRSPMTHTNALPARSMIDAGIPTALSSDNPCGPLDPLHNVRCAVDRMTCDGRILHEHEALTQSQAIKAASIDGMLGITGHSKQGIEAGAAADFVVCKGSPFAEGARISSTWINGRKIWPRSPQNGTKSAINQRLQLET